VQIQNHVRFKKRIPCEFQDESGRHIGMALNVFQSGFLVRSRTTPQMGPAQYCIRFRGTVGSSNSSKSLPHKARRKAFPKSRNKQKENTA